MNVQFTQPWWLLTLAPAVALTLWLGVRSDAQLDPWRRGAALAMRLVVVLCFGLAMAGLQWKTALLVMNGFFVLDRSQSVPLAQQQQARAWANRMAKEKKEIDQ